MTNDRIMELARQASDIELNPNPAFNDFLQRFAELVRNEVLEEAALICNRLDIRNSGACAEVIRLEKS